MDHPVDPPGPHNRRYSHNSATEDSESVSSRDTLRSTQGGGDVYSDEAVYSRGHEVRQDTEHRGAERSRSGQTWHDFLRESGGDAAEGPYPPFLDQHRRHASRPSHRASFSPRVLHPPARTPASSDRKRRSTAPDPPPSVQPGHYRGSSSVLYPRPPLPMQRQPRHRGHAYSVSVLPTSSNDLYTSPRQAPRPPLPPDSQQSSRRFSSFHQQSDYFHSDSLQDNDITPPPWQPDVEVSQCPVCSTAFTFFTRKHHCRKCGRVVCARCSPHRITIPRQYIVRQPLDDFDAGSPHTNASAGNVDSDAVLESFSPSTLNPALGGGEEVRVCNPCVPDPNFSPPPRRPEVPSIPSQPQQNLGRQLLLQRASEVREAFSLGRDGHLFMQRGSPTDTLSSGPRAVPAANGTTFPGFQDDQLLHRAPRLAPTSRARRVLSEDEICPVCGRELPPVPESMDRTTAREQHIADCITQRMGGSPATNAGLASGSGRHTTMSYQKLAYNATEKDCQGDECIMCFEEFMEGEELARLACLCKFHNTCIEQWWAVKGPGSCPTHQLQV